MKCKECLRFNKNEGATDFVYRDEMVKITRDDRGQMVAIYRDCSAPPSGHHQWIELKLKIWASKTWNKAWEMRYENSGHPTWIAWPLKGLPRRRKAALGGVVGSINDK